MFEKSTPDDVFQQKTGQSAGGVPAGFAERRAREWLAVAGITPNGHQPWDLQVHDPRLYARVMRQGSLGLGEAYMDGWWDCAELDTFFTRILQARLDGHTHNLRHNLHSLHGLLSNMQTKARAWIVGQRHYDLGNRLYERMLDSRMTYTCGYWRKADSLDQAQEHKLDLVCRKLNLSAGQRVLDIGCGWGSFAKFAAQRYGVEVVGLTISREQAELARQSCAGLSVEIRLQDYREVNEPFDHVVSLGMFEHVGWKNYRTYLEVVNRCLRDSGLFLLHTIGSNQTVHSADPWIDKYIFPNGSLPSAAQISKASEELFIAEDWHNFGADYDTTLMAWHANFEAAWAELSQQFDERFHRMWRYYLLACAGTFRARNTQLWQIVMSKHGVPGGYESIR